MTPDQQVLFNGAMTLLALVAGWVLRIVWTSITNLQKEQQQQLLQMAAIRELVAGSYATREELDKLSEALFRKLDRIESKLDGKADKPVAG
ncbi:MAG: hypothetical protein ACPHM2_09175 [Alcanivorax sp.]